MGSRGGPDAEDGWTLPTPQDFRLRPTVCSHGGYRYRPFQWDDGAGVLTRVIRDEEGAPRTITVREEVVERVEVLTGGAGARPEEIRTLALRIRTPGWEPGPDAGAAVDEAVVYMLGLARDVHRFHELCRGHEPLRRLPDLGAGRLLRAPTLWEDAARAILLSEAGWERGPVAVSAAVGLGPADGDQRAWPAPEAVLEAGSGELARRTGLERAPEHLVELARRIRRGSLDVEAAESGLLEPGTMETLFHGLPGLDAATADRLLILYGATDRIPLDEAAVAFLRDRHFGGRTPTPEEIRERYAGFGEWKGLAYWFEEVAATLWPGVGVGG